MVRVRAVLFLDLRPPVFHRDVFHRVYDAHRPMERRSAIGLPSQANPPFTGKARSVCASPLKENRGATRIRD